MGAKHELAPAIATAITGLPAGPCVDLFAGMCSVAGAVASSGRAVWCNDIQTYAASVAEVLVRAPSASRDVTNLAMRLFPCFEKNLATLKRRFAAELSEEWSALSCAEGWDRYRGIASGWRHAGNDPRLASEFRRLAFQPKTFPYRLTTLSFAHGFFGLRQSLELDSLRFAIDQLTDRPAATQDLRWAMVALIQTASHVATAPGHFAQYLKVRDQKTFRLIRRLRLRSVWTQFQVELDRITPYGTREWRATNRVYTEEASALASKLKQERCRPAVIYADPPYSRAQYSRYYHVLETLVRYDYPIPHGAGRYRPERFLTRFSHRSGVRSAFEGLARNVAELGACLVLSYPSNGILYAAGGDPGAILRTHWKSVRVVVREHAHSTMGGAPGHASSSVREQVFVATQPR